MEVEGNLRPNPSIPRQLIVIHTVINHQSTPHQDGRPASLSLPRSRVDNSLLWSQTPNDPNTVLRERRAIALVKTLQSCSTLGPD